VPIIKQYQLLNSRICENLLPNYIAWTEKFRDMRLLPRVVIQAFRECATVKKGCQIFRPKTCYICLAEVGIYWVL